MKRAVVLVGHGSKIAGSSDAINCVIETLKKKEPATLFFTAFLELQKPSIPEGIELCINQGAEEVIVIPYFVQSGRHVVQDIPKIVSDSKEKHPDARICLAKYLGFDERIVSVVQDKIEEARRK